METGVRRALGMPSLGGNVPMRPQATRQAEHQGPGHQKRRFVQDGEVPVVVLRGRGDGKPRTLDLNAGLSSSPAPFGAMEVQLRVEREAREAADRALAEANLALKDLRTRIGHASLALEEARETARMAMAERLAAETTLASEREARMRAEAEVAALQERLATALRGEEEMPVRRRPGRPRLSDQPGRPGLSDQRGRPRLSDQPEPPRLSALPEQPVVPEQTVQPPVADRPQRRRIEARSPGADQAEVASALAGAAPKPARGRPARAKSTPVAGGRKARDPAEPQPVKWWIKKKPTR